LGIREWGEKRKYDCLEPTGREIRGKRSFASRESLTPQEKGKKSPRGMGGGEGKTAFEKRS